MAYSPKPQLLINKLIVCTLQGQLNDKISLKGFAEFLSLNSIRFGQFGFIVRIKQIKTIKPCYSMLKRRLDF